jgi:uncharacterized protein (TIGR03000 family)
LDDPALAAGSRHVQPKEGYIMVKNSLACVGVIALATVVLLAVPASSEGGPFGLRGAGVGAMYNNSVVTTPSDVVYLQPTSPDMNPPRVGLFRRILGRGYASQRAFVPVAAGADTTTTSTSGYKPGDVQTTNATPIAPTGMLVPADANPPRVGLLRRIFNRNNPPTLYVYTPVGSDTMTTTTSGFRPGDATATPSSSTAFVLVDPNPPRIGLLRRLFNRNNTQPAPYTLVAAGNNSPTFSTSGYRPGDTVNLPRTGDDRARLRIALPTEKAEVWIEGQKTEQAKRVEDYVSPPLTPGKQYYYEVRARWTDAAGKQVERTRSFPIVPGQPVLLDFNRTPPKEETKSK